MVGHVPTIHVCNSHLAGPEPDRHPKRQDIAIVSASQDVDGRDKPDHDAAARSDGIITP